MAREKWVDAVASAWVSASLDRRLGDSVAVQGRKRAARLCYGDGVVVVRWIDGRSGWALAGLAVVIQELEVATAGLAGDHGGWALVSGKRNHGYGLGWRGW